MASVVDSRDVTNVSAKEPGTSVKIPITTTVHELSGSQPQAGAETQNTKAPPSSARPAGEPPSSKSGIRVPQISSLNLGLKVVYQPQDVDETTVDIIAIHGIGVNPLTTWVHPASKTNWLAHESMLPLDVPHARIMTFNYDSVWFGDTPTRLTIDSVALSLLDALQRARSQSPSASSSSDRPIIFVAHCFGGLVAQRAYTLAHMRAVDYPRVPAQLIRGLVFLGTPHHGLSDRAQNVTSEKLYKAIARANMRMQTDLNGTMVQDNATLLSVVDDFTRQLNTAAPRPVVLCYYETKPTYIGIIANLDIEPEFMVNETAGTLSGHRKASMALDHFSMNKFQSRECSHYQHISYEVKNMVETAMAMSVADPAPVVKSSKSAERNTIPAFCFPLGQEKNFAPRDGILKRIDAAFQKTERVALYGESGLGKTHIAVQYAYDYHRSHPSSSIFWINASTTEEFELTCHFIDEYTNNGSHENRDSGKMLNSVTSHLKRASKRDLLIILDGLDDDSSLTATHDPAVSLLGLLPRDGQTRILATSRSKSVAMRWTSPGPKESVVCVAPLTLEDTSVILFGRVVNEGRLNWASDVGKRLRSSAGELSLVLQYMTLLDKNCSKSRKEYADMIGASSSSKSNSNPEPRSRQQPSLAWKPLYGSIKARGATEAHMNLMDMICVMDTQCVPSILFDRAERSTEIPDLIKYGIVEPSADRRVYTATAMIRDCINLSLSRDEGGKDAREAAQEVALGRVSRLFSTDPIELLPCALSVLRFEPRSPPARAHLISLNIDVALHIGLLKQYGRAKGYLDASAQLLKGLPDSGQKMKDLSRRVKEALERIEKMKAGVKDSNPGHRPSQDNHIVATRGSEKNDEENRVRLSHDRAMLQLAQAEPDTDVVTRIKEASAWSARTHGTNAVRSAEHEFNVGLAYLATRQYTEAEKLFKTMLARITASPTSETNNRSMQEIRYKVQAELARLYCEQGRYGEARAAYESVYPDQRGLLGDDHRDTLATRHNFAALRQELGDVDGALGELEAIFQVQAASSGPNDPAVMRTAGTIALNSMLGGNLTKAERQFATVFKAQMDVLGEKHYETVNTGRMLVDVRERMKLVD